MISWIKKSENIYTLMFIPSLIFIISRITSFLNEAWSLELGSMAGLICFAALLLLAFFLRKKIYDWLTENAYGFSSQAIIIYFLAIFVAIKYKGVFISNCIGYNAYLCVFGAGLLLGLFTLLIMKALEKVISIIKGLKLGKKDALVLLLALVIINVCSVLYALFLKQIFVWDNAGYFTYVIKMNDAFPSIDYFREVYHSIIESDYNYLIMIPSSIACKLFGKSRLVFILSIANFYLFPLMAMVYLFAKKVFGKEIISTLVVFLSLPYMIFATNTGFIDIGGVIPAFLGTVLFLYSRDKSLPYLSGFFLAIAVLMRRWFSFYALSFVIISFIPYIKERKIRDSIKCLCTFAFTLLFFAQSFVTGKLMADYSNMYSAYSLGLKTDILIFTRYFGVLLTAILIINTIIKRKKAELFILLQAVLCFSIFAMVQTHGQQHLCLYLPFYIIAIFSLIAVKNKSIYIGVILLSAIQSVNTVIPREQPKSIGEIKSVAIIPNFTQLPPRNNNVDNILKICEYLDSEIGEKGKTVCLLASSLELNYDTFKNAELSLSKKQRYDIDREDYFLKISEVDNRDGFSENLFLADYVLVPSSLQIHLAEEEQEVISVPYEMIVSGELDYEKTNVSFDINDELKLYLYERKGEISKDRIEKIKAIAK